MQELEDKYRNSIFEYESLYFKHGALFVNFLPFEQQYPLYQDFNYNVIVKNININHIRHFQEEKILHLNTKLWKLLESNFEIKKPSEEG